MAESIASTPPAPTLTSLQEVAFGILQVREKILDHLVDIDDRQALLNMALTSKQLYREVVEAAQRRDVRPLKRFISLANRALWREECYISEALNELQFPKNSMKIGKAFSILKESTRSYTCLIIKILKELDAFRLKTLKKEMTPLPHCENILDLALMEHRIDQARALEKYHPDRSETLKLIVSDLLEQGDIDRAIELAEQIDVYVDLHYRIDSWIKDAALQQIVFALLAVGNIEKAVIIAEQMYRDNASVAFQNIVFALVKQGAIERAFVIVEKIRFCYNTLLALEQILSAKLKEDDIKKVLEIAEQISCEEGGQEGQRLKIVVLVQLKQGNIDEAIAIAEQIPDGELDNIYYKSEALRAIVFVLFRKGDMDRAIEIVKQIPKGLKSKTLKKVALALIKKGDIDKAMFAAKHIPNENIKQATLREIARHFPPKD